MTGRAEKVCRARQSGACSWVSRARSCRRTSPVTSAEGGMGTAAAVECLDGRMRVLPGQPASSYLIDKMTNVDLCQGTQMPKLGLIPNAQIQTVVDWICEGAPNN